MQINVTLDTSALDKLAKRYDKNLAYSTAQALNATVLEAQKRIRAHMRQVFHVRRADFIDRSIKVFAFASVGQDRVYAEIGIDQKPRLLLSVYETGGQRVPFKGKSMAVPLTGGVARPSASASVNPSYTFQALHFQRGPITQQGRRILAARSAKGIRKQKLAGHYYVWKGANRTFILPATKRAPYGGVFQRVGPGRDDLRLIYSFRRAMQLRKVLEFVDITQQAYNDVFREVFFQKFYRLAP